jgi:hypothetical protein
MIGTVELVLFAIQAAVRLAKTGRTIYVETTASREVVMPLPAGFSNPLVTARDYAYTLQHAKNPRFASEFQQAYDDSYAMPADADTSPDAATARAKARLAQQTLIQLYLVDAGRGLVSGIDFEQRELAGVAALKQWSEGESPFPHPLQRVAGALVEVAVDYFVSVPGAINESSRNGRLIKSFLRGLESFDFQEARWDAIVIGLFTASLDALKENADLLGRDEATQGLIKTIVSGVASDLRDRVTKLGPVGDLDAEARLQRCGELVLRSLLSNAGKAVVSNPSILGVRGATEKALVQEVGTAFLDLLLEGNHDTSLGATIERLASTDNLDRLMHAALKAVAEHPDYFLTGKKPVDQWLKQVLTDLHNDLAGKSFFDPDLFGDVAYVVLDNAITELPALLAVPDGGKALIVAVARGLFEALSTRPTSGAWATWKFDLSRSEIVTVFDAATRALAAHPDLITRDPAAQQALVSLLPALVAALGDVAGGTLRLLLRGNRLTQLLTAALASSLASRLQGLTSAKLVPILTSVLNEVLADGTAGLDDLLADGRVTDFCRALAGSPLLARLTGDDPSARETAARRLVGLVSQLRRGQNLTVAEMRGILNA